MSKISETLRALGLGESNAGAWSGSHGWSSSQSGAMIESINPSSGERLAQVRSATAEDYERVLGAAVGAAPVRRAAA